MNLRHDHHGNLLSAGANPTSLRRVLVTIAVLAAFLVAAAFAVGSATVSLCYATSDTHEWCGG